MKDLLDKLIKIDKETDWLAIAAQCGRMEYQIQIRAEIIRAIKRLEKQLENPKS
jgi:hypothetical protein